MPYTNTTRNYELHQWVPSDKPSHLDFNQGFEKVDEVLAGKAEQKTTYSKAEVDAALANKVNRERPEEYAFPYVVGYKGAESTYSKTQENIVIINFKITKDDNSAFGCNTFFVATMPVGFRPAKRINCAATSVITGGSVIQASSQAVLHSDGRLALQVTDATATEINGSFCFVASR